MAGEWRQAATTYPLVSSSGVSEADSVLWGAIFDTSLATIREINAEPTGNPGGVLRYGTDGHS